MLRFIAKRLLLALPTLWAVLTLVFVLVRVVPGDPTIIVLGDQASPAAREQLRQRLGLDKPLLVQYGEFMVQIAQGDLGRSLVTNRPISADVAAVLPYTIELTLAALFIGSLIGVPLGVVAAQRRDGFVDWLARIVSLAGLSFPAFVSGHPAAHRLRGRAALVPGDLDGQHLRPARAAARTWRCRPSISGSSWSPTSPA